MHGNRVFGRARPCAIDLAARLLDAMTSEAARANRRALDSDERARRAEEARREPAPRERSAVGTIGFHEEAQAELRQALDRVPDARIAERTEADRIWQGALAACETRFGRKPSTDAWTQASDADEVLLRAAQRAEADFLGVALTGASARTIEEARKRFGDAVLAWLNTATRGWESGAEYRARVARDQEWR
jgi:hypothetical protein